MKLWLKVMKLEERLFGTPCRGRECVIFGISETKRTVHSGSVHVNLYLDFSRAWPQKWLTCRRKKKSGYDGIIIPVGK